MKIRKAPRLILCFVFYALQSWVTWCEFKQRFNLVHKVQFVILYWKRATIILNIGFIEYFRLNLFPGVDLSAFD